MWQLSLSWCMAVLRWWSHLSGLSRFCVLKEDRRWKRREEKIKRSREDEERRGIEMKREERGFFLWKTSQTRKSARHSRTIPVDELFVRRLRILPVFSNIRMIRIRIFGPWELIQNEFRAEQYSKVCASWAKSLRAKNRGEITWGDSDQERCARKVAWVLSKKITSSRIQTELRSILLLKQR